MRNPGAAPGRRRRGDVGRIDPHAGRFGSRQGGGAGVMAWLVRGEPAGDADFGESFGEQCRADRPVCLRRRRRAQRNVETGNQSDPGGRRRCQGRGGAPQAAPGSFEQGGDVAPDIDLNQPLDLIDQRMCKRPVCHRYCEAIHRHPLPLRPLAGGEGQGEVGRAVVSDAAERGVAAGPVLGADIVPKDSPVSS